MLLGAAALLVVVAIALSFFYYEAQRGRAASARFDQALSELQGGKYESAEKELSSLAADEPHRAVGRLANLYLANAYLAQKEPGKARDALTRYLAEDDEEAFAEIVRRNGPLVLRACRHVLAEVTAAEDAFQATFLLLARKGRRLTAA